MPASKWDIAVESARSSLKVNCSVVEFFAEFRRRISNETLPNVVIHDNVITVLRLSSQGPDASASFSERGWLVAVAGWHDEMPKASTAIDILVSVVQGKARVRIDSLGSKPWQYALEIENADGTWTEESVVTLPRLRRFGKLRHSYVQNAAPKIR